jgi:uncharacterized protein
MLIKNRRELLAIARLEPEREIPGWAMSGPLWSVARSEDEISIVCEDRFVPAGHAKVERGWHAFQLAGPIPFELTGVLASVLEPLAEARIPVFAFSTWDTDYVLVKAYEQARAQEALGAAGHVLL